jgi:hypothetical protein
MVKRQSRAQLPQFEVAYSCVDTFQNFVAAPFTVSVYVFKGGVAGMPVWSTEKPVRRFVE